MSHQATLCCTTLQNLCVQLQSVEALLAQTRLCVETMLTSRNENEAAVVSAVPHLPVSVQAVCASALSSSKRRRLRAKHVRNRLWANTGLHSWEPVVDVCEGSVELSAGIVPPGPVVNEVWSDEEIENWIRATLRLANAGAMKADTREKALLDRMTIIRHEWDRAVLHIPSQVQDEMLEILSDPLGV